MSDAVRNWRSRAQEIPHGNDTTVQCKKCGRKQHLMFANGLKNGWSQCCGYTMPIIQTTANIKKAVGALAIQMEVDITQGRIQLNQQLHEIWMLLDDIEAGKLSVEEAHVKFKKLKDGETK